MPKFSLIIVNWNVTDLVTTCLQSFHATQYPAMEIIVIDNASADQKSLLQLKKTISDITLIENATNLGFPRAVNQGLQQCSGDFIVIINPDTRVPKNFFTACLEFFSNYPDAGLMSPVFENPDGSLQGSVFPEPSILKSIREFWLNQGPLTQKFTPAVAAPIKVNAVSGGCFVLPRSTYARIGLFTESVFMYYEDMDYCRRMRRAGLPIYLNPGLHIVHEHGRSSAKSSQSYQYLVASSKWYNGLLKHYFLWFISFTGQRLHGLFG